METDRLKHFCVLAELESLTKASEVIGISRSGLHKSIRSLSDELGFELTRVNGRGIALTEKALAIYPRLKKIVADVEKLKNPEEQKVDSPRLRVGGLEVFLPFMSKHLTLKSEFPVNKYEFHEFAPGHLEQAVNDDIVDIGITYIPMPIKGIAFLKIKSFKMSVLSMNKEFSKIPSEEVPFVVPSSPLELNPANIKNRDGWGSNLFKRKVEFKTNSLFSALQIVENKLAAIYVPNFLSDCFSSKPTQLNLLKNSEKRDCYLVLPERREESTLEKKMAKYLRKYI